MALDVLLARLEQEAREEAEAITARAEAEAGRILGRAEADIKRRRVLHVERLEAEGRAALGRELAATVYAHRARFLAARADALERVFTRAGELLRVLPAEQYRERIPSLAVATLKYFDEAGAVVTCRPELVDLVRGAVSDWPAASIVADPAALPGLLGRASDGGVEVDNTLPALLARQRDDLAITMAERIAAG
jgi:vacuolar-type H+-ATPase subunit E/Vma4